MRFISDVFSYLKDDALAVLSKEMSSWPGNRDSFSSGIRCFAFVVQEGFCIRTNTLAAYCEMNKQVCVSLSGSLDRSTADRNQFSFAGHNIWHWLWLWYSSEIWFSLIMFLSVLISSVQVTKFLPSILTEKQFVASSATIDPKSQVTYYNKPSSSFFYSLTLSF